MDHINRLTWDGLKEGFGVEDIAVRHGFTVSEVRQCVRHFRSQPHKLNSLYGRAPREWAKKPRPEARQVEEVNRQAKRRAAAWSYSLPGCARRVKGKRKPQSALTLCGLSNPPLAGGDLRYLDCVYRTWRYRSQGALDGENQRGPRPVEIIPRDIWSIPQIPAPVKAKPPAGEGEGPCKSAENGL